MKKHNAFTGLLILAFLTMSFVHQNGWFLFENNHYKMLFPKKPADQTQTVNTALGELKMDIHMYEVPGDEQDDNFTYGMIETAYPDSVINSNKKDLLEKFFRNSI